MISGNAIFRSKNKRIYFTLTLTKDKVVIVPRIRYLFAFVCSSARKFTAVAVLNYLKISQCVCIRNL